MGSWKDEVTMVQITQEQVEADLQCYICLDDLVAGEEVMKLSCSHHYHEPCISPWLDKNNICPTCRQKILRREDPDPEEFDFEFDAGFLTDIIREINNIVYGVESDEEFFHSDSTEIIDLTISSDGETLMLEELSPRSERSTTGQDTVSGDSVLIEVVHPQEPESRGEQTVLSDVSSGGETYNHQIATKSVKRGRSFEVEDSSEDEGVSLDDKVWLLPDVNGNQQHSLSSQNAQPIKELIPCSINRNNTVGSRRKLRKRQRRSFEVAENQYDQDSSDEEFGFHTTYKSEVIRKCQRRSHQVDGQYGQDSSDEDFEFQTTYTSEIIQIKSEETKQLGKGIENSEETKRDGNSKSVNESHDDEAEEGVFVFDMVEVESLVSKLLEIMNQGEDENNTNEEEEVVPSGPEEWKKRGVLNEENIRKIKNSDDECDEIYNNENSKICLNNKEKAFSKSIELVRENEFNSIVPIGRPIVERIPSPGHRKGNKGQPVKRKICSSCSSDDESSDDNKEFPVKRRASSSNSDSGNDEDSDGFENIEQIISELWDIVTQDEEESQYDENGSGDEQKSNKSKQKCLQTSERAKTNKINHQPLLQSKNN